MGGAKGELEMGLFGSLTQGLESTFGKLATSEISALLPAALQAAGLGNLQSVVNQLQQAGLGQQVESWAQGHPTPVTAEELSAIVNNDQVKQLAEHFGVDPNVVLHLLAAHLPGAIQSAAQSGDVSTTN
jgi:uncharacterized protein YidB (DUF937 family)